MTKVAVCQLEAREERLEASWEALRRYAEAERPELLLLPEMGLSPWLAASAHPDPAAWERGERVHRERIERFPDLGVAIVAGTMPVTVDGHRFNEGFVWTAGEGYRAVHRKTYLPDEPGFWEATWYERGPTVFEPLDTPVGRIGFLICTELWFLEHARAYSKAGVDFVLCPRATPSVTLGKWLAGGRAAAVVSGAYCLSSNHADGLPELAMAGTGWIAEPEEGALLGTTSDAEPFLGLEVDVGAARAAKRTYPRSVDDSPR